MSTRERRVSRPSLKFADEYWEQGRRRDNRPVRQVYRLLKHKDIRKDLAGQEVHVYWPEDQQWYRGAVEEVSLQQLEQSAYLHYPDTDEYEDVNLTELVESKQVAVIENRSVYAKLKRDEIPVDVADRLSAVYEDDDSGAGDAGSDGDDSVDDEDDDEPRISREHHKQVQRAKRPRENGMERTGNAKRTATTNSGGDEGAVPREAHPPNVHHPHGNGHAVRSTPGGAAAAAAAAGEPLAAPDSDMAEAEAFKNSLMSALMHTFSGPPSNMMPSTMIPTPGGAMIPTPGGAVPGPGPGPGGHAPMIMIPTPGSAAAAGDAPGSGRGAGGSARGERRLRTQTSLPTAGSVGNDDEVRLKVREQLASALQRALEELKAEGYTEALPEPAAVAADVEAELYKLHDNSVSKDYKAKFRSLSFNLRDNANPELRARVLRGELPSATLVTLGAAELARKELSEWRQKRQEEAVKMVFLDAETAAKFSTAAAAALAQSRMQGKEEEAPAAKPTASPERAATAADDSSETAAGHGHGDGATAAALDGGGVLPRRSSSGLPHTTSGGGDGADASAPPELARRTSVQGVTGADAAGADGAAGGGWLPATPATLPAAPPGAAAAAAAGTLSPNKRTVLRAALPVVPTAGDETPPRADAAGDAPYDPDSYADEPYDPEAQHPDDEDGSMPKYDPLGSETTAATAGKSLGSVSVASLRAAPAATAPPTAGGADRHSALASPVRSPPAAAVVVADLAPIIQRQQPGEGPMSDLPPDNVGETLWTGVMRVPGQPADQLVVVEVSYLGGSGRLGPMLRCSEPPSELLVKGQVKLSRVEQFFEELRRSRSRTITLALVRQLSHEAAAAAGLSEAAAAAARDGGILEFVAQHRSRTGLATPQTALEAYLVTRGSLAARLLKTARAVCPSHQLALLPDELPEDELLLAMVHPRTWEPPPHVRALPPSQSHQPPHRHPHYTHHQHHQHQQQQQHDERHQQQQQHGQEEPYDPAAAALPPPPFLDLSGLEAAAAAAGLLPPPSAAGGIDPRIHGAAAEAPPLQPPPAGIDLSALSDLAAALGIPGSGAQHEPIAPAAPPPPVIMEAPGGGNQLVTVVMQNPDGTLSIVAMPQGAAPPPAAGTPPPAMLLPPLEHQHMFQGQQQQQPHPHSHPEYPGLPQPQYLQPQAGPYGEPPPHEHYPGSHGPPPPGRYGAPPLPYADHLAGPPPPHHGYPPQQQHPPPPQQQQQQQPPQDPYYNGPPQQQQHNYQPPPHGHAGSDPGAPLPYGPPRDGPDGRPPPYYPPREGPDGPYGGPGGYDDPYYHRGGGGGGPPGPHGDAPYPYHHGGPPGRGGRGPPRGDWGGEHGRWGGGRRGGGGGGRGRGPPEEGRGGGGYGYDAYDRGGGGGRAHDGGGYRGGGRGGGGRDRGEWGGGERREWEGGRGDRGEWGRDRDRDRGGYGRPEGHHPR